VWVFIVLQLLSSHALIHKLVVENDERKEFKIESFGLATDGRISLSLEAFKVLKGEKLIESNFLQEGPFGFFIKISDSESFTIVKNSNTNCILRHDETKDEKPLIIADRSWKWDYIVPADAQGLYSIFFISCPEEPTHIWFTMTLEMYNVDALGNRNYLSIGDTSLPTLYTLLAIAYGIIICVWIFTYIRKSKIVNRLHWLMTVLVLLKALTLIWQAFQYHSLKRTGYPAGWNVVYYIFAFIRGVMLFVVILLIGTGWTFIKSYLNDKDKKILLVVIPLQVLANIALIVVGESSPGSQQWIAWRDVFNIVDIICCAAILIPILWSIKHLRQAAQTDGKAAKSLKKMQLFRKFYLMVISYIYFTRIVVVLLVPIIPYQVSWLRVVLDEAATLLFYVIIGYWFRPVEDNPYFKVESDDDDLQLHEIKTEISE